MAVGRLKVVEQVLECGHLRIAALLLFFTSLTRTFVVLHVDRLVWFGKRRLDVDLLLVVVHFEVLGQAADDFAANLRVLVERIVLEVEHAERLEVLQVLHELDHLHVREIDLVVPEVHQHDVVPVLALDLQFHLCDVVGI